MLPKQSISLPTFKQWLRKDPENRKLMVFSLTLTIMQFAWLKFLYPYPNFMPPDSEYYIEAATNNYTINFWAIGYSKFLRLISSFTSSHFALVLFQYLFLQASLLYFLFSIRYWLSPGKWVFRVMIGSSILNPLLPHISNYVASDALFTALSLIWFTQLMWLLYHPTGRILIYHSFILLFAFMVRHNAMYYPFISIGVIAFAHLPIKLKWLGSGYIAILLGFFIGYTQYHYHKETNTIQYTAFGGWQLAANALYGYAHAKSDPPNAVPSYLRELHILVNQHMDSLRQLKHRPDNEVAIYYLWDEQSPLKKYMHHRWKYDSTTSVFTRWASMAPLYAAYGRHLISQHPGLFIRFYVQPNLFKYFVPPTKFMGVYNLGNKTVTSEVGKWFGWKSNKVFTHYGDTRILVTEYFSGLIAIINLVFILSLIGLIYVASFKYCISYGNGIACLVGLVWFFNMAFSVFSAPIELRYQLFPMITMFVFGVLLLTLMIQTGRSASLIGNR